MNEFERARREARLSAQEASRRIGIQYQSLWKYETGRSVPSMQTIRKMAEVYGVDPNYLFGWPKNPSLAA